MGKKRKHSEVEAPAAKKEVTAPERPQRTLLGWKEKPENQQEHSTGFRNREKVLVTCSRRINYRYRHLMLNLVSVLPHCKKDNKVESKATKGATLNELVELKSCSSCLFFECRKHKDLYLWMAKSPNGPSVKFLVNAVHTMEELKLTGNHLKGSRPLLTFSSNFDKDPHWKLLKEMIVQIFGTPKEHRKSKPYHDHVFVFSIVDDHIWFRNYQISCPHTGADKIDRGGLEKMTLIEVGPRFCLNPIKIFGGSFGGPTLYENPFYVSPNQIRSLETQMQTIRLISLVLLFQAMINGVNPAIPPNQQSTKCSRNGNLNSDKLLKSRDAALEELYTGFVVRGPYNGARASSDIGIWARALCPPRTKVEDCRECVKDTIPVLKKNCPNQKEGATWSSLPRMYCMVRYADHADQGNLAGWAWARFFTPPSLPPTPATAGELEKGLNNLANILKENATNINSLDRYGSGSIRYGPGPRTLYGSMQCAPSISDEDCKKCLSDATGQIHDCCSKLRKLSGKAFSVNCAFWYSHDNVIPKTLTTISIE